MPGIASLYAEGADDGTKLHVFSIGSDNNLQLHSRDEGDVNDTPETHDFSTQGIEGTIVNSQITSAQVVLDLKKRDLVYSEGVIGFTNKDDDGESHNVSVISPKYISLDKTEKHNSTIASCFSECDSWVYYFKGAQDDRILVECHPVLGESHEIDDTIQIDSNSSLAAYYDAENERRSVIIQGASNSTFYEYYPEGDGDTQRLKYTDDARAGTPLAAVYVNGNVYLYYTNRSNELRIVTKQIGRSWGSPQEVQGSPVDTASQLTVVASEKGNHLFYVAEGSDESEINHVLHVR
ncbi:hypothetical protein DER44DRAFT_857070 [Fusarium oxysporum]|nr:hypothetical protein DER44DRAFT_857070 [Fusarium oxysporum]